MSNKSQGTRAEWAEIKRLEAEGYTVMRGTSSHGVADLMGMKRNGDGLIDMVLVQVKSSRTGRARIKPKERRQLEEWRGLAWVQPVLRFLDEFGRKGETCREERKGEEGWENVATIR